MLQLQQTSAPTVEPVTRAEAKNWAKIDITDDDAIVDALVTAARRKVEQLCRRQLVQATWKLSLDEFPAGDELIVLPRPPLLSVSSVKYVDTAGVTTTLAAAKYHVQGDGEPARLVPAYGEVWPETREQLGAVTVTYIAGHAAEMTAVAATDVLTVSARTFADGDKVRLWSQNGTAAGTLPGGLAVATDYYVRDYTANTFKLAATSGGAAIDVTSAGTGTHYVGLVPEELLQAIKILAAELYLNREASRPEGINILPFAFEALIAPYVQHYDGAWAVEAA